MRSRWLYLLLATTAASSARGDQFDAIEGKALAAALKGPEAKAVERLTLAELGALPNPLKDARAALLAVKTGKGNITRLLVTPELRKGDDGEAVPVFVIERFDTFDAADLSARVAGGRAMMLFPGFQVDLDTGQVVPEGQGGDLVYSDERWACSGLDSWCDPLRPHQGPRPRPHEAAPADARPRRGADGFRRPLSALGQRPVVGDGSTCR